ncbi:hypothetical protein [Peptostreptococcus porci]|uniref:hypothetical protein n=1 Tax=Peptostreptococcus porci TaxID=2652282 RepID=UPI0023F42784|nr:hypothetical protein [Peptostreptococcus porci]MDD7182358.1 hypothetical protein [Peptostreptococcus porci]
MSKRKQVEVPKEKIEAQEEFIERIHRMNEDEFNKTGKKKSWLCHTIGCQMMIWNMMNKNSSICTGILSYSNI